MEVIGTVLMGRDGIPLILLLFTFLIPLFLFLLPFISFFLSVFFFSSFHIFFSSSSSSFLLFVYCNFLEKKKITLEEVFIKQGYRRVLAD